MQSSYAWEVYRYATRSGREAWLLRQMSRVVAAKSNRLLPCEIFFICRLTRIFSRRYSVRIILVRNHVLRTNRPDSPSHGFELTRKDATLMAAQPSEPSSRQSNRMQRPQAARAVFRLGAAESNGGK
jgi:hypothetical protein